MNMLTTGRKLKHTVLTCALECLGSPRCGWLLYTKDKKKCSGYTYLSCTNHNLFVTYRRLPFGIQGAQNKRDSTFELINPQQTICSSNKSSCHLPDAVENANVQYDVQIPGSKARYTCKVGFSYCGPPTEEVTCLVNGSWTQPKKICHQDTWLTKQGDTVWLVCLITPGSFLEINGIAEATASFNFKLLSRTSKVVLSLDVVFKSNVSTNLVQSTGQFTSGTWRKTKRATNFPFTLGKQFKMTISIRASMFAIYVDDKFLMIDFHVFPLDKIRGFRVTCMEVVRIHFGKRVPTYLGGGSKVGRKPLINDDEANSDISIGRQGL